MKSLNDHKLNIFSQFGEDGIIQEILRRIGDTPGICVEFGAWDGVLVANTANLWANYGWEAVLIEPEMEKFSTLKKITAEYKCVCIPEFVTPIGDHSLENILKRHNVSHSKIKLLSIDIDGNEYHIFNELNELKPPVVILEYNPTIPPNILMISKEDAFFGSSAKALCSLAEQKGYILVAMTKTNCFFVDKKLASSFSDVSTSYNELFDPSCLTYLITGYKGSYAYSQPPAFGIGLPLDRRLLIDGGDMFYINYSSLRVKWNYTKDKVKAVLKRIIGGENIENIRSTFSYLKWIIHGKPIPAHGRYKWKVLKRESRKYNTEIFIETGTAGGGTVLNLENNFKTLYTIELDQTLYHQGKARVGNRGKIICLQGDSGIVINEILNKLDTPATFWLDAHYSGIGTAKGQLDTPIINELRSIFTHKIKNHVIIIDDAREFNGHNDYPPIENIEKMVKLKAPEYEFRRDNDLIIIAPYTSNIS